MEIPPFFLSWMFYVFNPDDALADAVDRRERCSERLKSTIAFAQPGRYVRALIANIPLPAFILRNCISMRCNGAFPQSSVLYIGLIQFVIWNNYSTSISDFRG